jgi:hypothetical protein
MQHTVGRFTVVVTLRLALVIGWTGCGERNAGSPDAGPTPDPGTDFIQELPPGLSGVGGSTGSGPGGEGGGGGFAWRTFDYPAAARMPGEAPADVRTTPTRAYLPARDETQVFDIAQLDAGQVGSLPAAGPLFAIDQNGRLPMLARSSVSSQRGGTLIFQEIPTSELQVFDLHGPAETGAIARLPLRASALVARRLGFHLFVAAREPADDVTGARDSLVLLLFDLSDPTAPREVLRLPSWENQALLAADARRVESTVYDGGDHFLLLSAWQPADPSAPRRYLLTAYELDPAAASIRERKLLDRSSVPICWAGYSPPRDAAAGLIVHASAGAQNCLYSLSARSIEVWAVPAAGDPTRVESFDSGPLRSSGFDPQRRRLYLSSDQGVLSVVDLTDPTAPRRTEVAGVGAIDRLQAIGDGRFALATGLAAPGQCPPAEGAPDPSFVLPPTPLGGPAVTLVDTGDASGFRLVERLCGGGISPPTAGARESEAGRFATAFRGRIDLFSWNLAALAGGAAGHALEATPAWSQDPEAWGATASDLRLTEIPDRPTLLIHNHSIVAPLHLEGSSPRVGPIVSRGVGPSELFALDGYVAVVSASDGAEPKQRALQIHVLPLSVGAAPVATLTLPGGAARLRQHGQLLLMVTDSCLVGPDGVCWRTHTVQVYDLRQPAHPRAAGMIQLPFSSGEMVDLADGLAAVRLYQPEFGLDRFELLHIDLTDPDRPRLTSTALDPLSETGVADAWYGAVAEQRGPAPALHLTYRRKLGDTTRDGSPFERIQYLARRFVRQAGRWQAGPPFALPGRLHTAWSAPDGVPFYLTSSWEPKPAAPDPFARQLRLSLARGTAGRTPELLDSRVYEYGWPSEVLPDGNRLLLWSWPGQLEVFDLSGKRLQSVFQAPSLLRNPRLIGVRDDRLVLRADPFTFVIDLRDPAQLRAIKRVSSPAILDPTAPSLHHRASSLGIRTTPIAGPPEIPLVDR